MEKSNVDMSGAEREADKLKTFANGAGDICLIFYSRLSEDAESATSFIKATGFEVEDAVSLIKVLSTAFGFTPEELAMVGQHPSNDDVITVASLIKKRQAKLNIEGEDDATHSL